MKRPQASEATHEIIRALWKEVSSSQWFLKLSAPLKSITFTMKTPPFDEGATDTFPTVFHLFSFA